MAGNDEKQEDREMVGRARRGDRDAFTALVGRYRDMVYGTAFHSLGSAEDAQDAAQEAFVAAYTRLGQLRATEKFAPWLRRLTLNVCADARRRRGALPSVWEGDCPEPMAGDFAAALATRLAVRDALARLPERMRLTVTLCCLDGYSHAEVGVFLGIPVNTVRSRLQHAKRQLREEMRDMVSEELNQGRPGEDWTRQTVEEALRRGKEAAAAYEKGEAVRHYNAALTAIEALPPGPEQTRLTMDALWQKGKALDPLRFGTGDVVALWERSIALAEQLSDRHSLMAKRMDLGGAFYNSGQDTPAVAQYEQAQAIAQELGDARGQAQCLTSLALGRLWGDRAQGMALFAQALPLYEAAGDLNGTTYCHAMLALAAELGPENLRVDFSPEQGFQQPIIGFYAGCDVLRSEAGTVSHPSETCYIGYTWPDDLERSPLKIARVFWLSSHLRKIVDTSVPVGGSWSGNAFSDTPQPLKATVTVISDTERMTVPAGTFEGCRLTEQVTTEDGPQTEANRSFRGTVRAWYAPGIGLVRLHAHHEDGLEAAIELQAYAVRGKSGELLPLAVGNRWDYGWADVPAEYAAREVYRVAAQKEEQWYVEHWAYAYQKPRG